MKTYKERLADMRLAMLRVKYTRKLNRNESTLLIHATRELDRISPMVTRKMWKALHAMEMRVDARHASLERDFSII